MIPLVIQGPWFDVPPVVCPSSHPFLLTSLLKKDTIIRPYLSMVVSYGFCSLRCTDSFIIGNKRLYPQGLDVRRQNGIEKLRMTSDQQSARN